ncbi:MAG: leucine-rich repeat protein [Oscillospiraceae bacterium]|nr:leucine-rich repeat protein [Oscillospiraceae bacterium]
MLQKFFAWLMASVMALFAVIGVVPLTKPVDFIPAQQRGLFGAVGELPTHAGSPLDELPPGIARSGFSTQSSASGVNFGDQLIDGNAVSVYNALKTITPAGFDEVSQQTDPALNYVELVTQTIPVIDQIVYRRAYMDQGPNNDDMIAIGELLKPHFQAALEAYERDYPEVFWLAKGEPSQGGTSFVPDGTAALDGPTLVITITTIEMRLRVKPEYKGQVSSASTALALEADQLVPPPYLGLTRQQIVTLLHDAVIDAVGPRKDYFSPRADDATGPLLKRFPDNETVAPFGSAMGCAKAFKLLCDAAGIPSVIVSGIKTYQVQMTHAWNLVQMEDGFWYAVDTLLDNGITGSFSNRYTDYLLAGSNTVDLFFDNQRFDQSHIASGYFTNQKFFLFQYPALSPSRYTTGTDFGVLESALSLELKYPAHCYTDTSLALLEEKRGLGEIVLNSGTEDQDEIDLAALAILSAYAGLVPLPILLPRTGASVSVSFSEHRVTFSTTGVTPAEFLSQYVISGLPISQVSVTLAQPGFQYVGTGAEVTVSWTREGQPCAETYSVLLLGDTNGDGLVDGSDTPNTDGLYEYVLTPEDNAIITRVNSANAEGAIVLPQALDGHPVVGVAARAFEFCSDVTELIVGDHITALGEYAFYFMTGLEKVTLGNGVTMLPEGLFFFNESLREVQFGDNLYSIGKNAFAECVSLQSAELPDTTRVVADSAFAGCLNLRDLTLNDGLSSIGQDAFNRCAWLGDVLVPTSVTEIGRNAFANCSNITIVCSYGSTIHAYALQYGIRYRVVLILRTLRVAELPTKTIYFTGESFLTAGMQICAVYDDGSETLLASTSYTVSGFDSSLPGESAVTVTYQNRSVTFMVRVYDFRYTMIENNTKVMATAYVGNDPIAQLPAVIEGKPVTSLGNTAFNGRADVTEIVLPASLQEILPGAFDGAAGAQGFSLLIGSAAFSAEDGILYDAGGTQLVAYPGGRQSAGFTLPDRVTSVGARAFSGNSHLAQLNVGLEAAQWAANAVRQCPALVMYGYEYSPAHLYAMGEAVPFVPVHTADDIDFTPPTKVNYIVRQPLDTDGMALWLLYSDGTEYQVFSGYTLSEFQNQTSGPRTITLTFHRFTPSFTVIVSESDSQVYRYTLQPNGTAQLVRYLGSGGYLVIPAAIDGYPVSSLGMSLFEGNQSITGIYVPENIKEIHNRALANCNSLTEIVLPEGLLKINNEAFYHCAALESVNIPSTVTEIGSYAFAECASLLTAEIPDAALSVGSYVFANCAALETVTVGSGLESMGNYVFNGCASLQNVFVSPGNANFQDTGGILLDAAGTVILRFPQGRTAVSYTVPDEITDIGPGAFSGAQLSEVTILRNVTSVSSTAFNGASAALLISCYRNSAAHLFAQQYGVLFSLLPDPTVTAISVASPPAQTEYFVGDPFNAAGLVIEATYSDGSIQEVPSGYNGYSLSGFSSAAVGSCTVTVSYQTRFSSFTVTIQAVPANPDFVFSLSGGNAYITAYTGTSDTVRIPAATTISGTVYPVAGISMTGGSGAFEGNQWLQRVVIPSTIGSIAARAFRNCANLTEVVLPENLSALPNQIFEGCASLTDLVLPASLQSIGEYAFSGCGIKYLPLPEGLETLASFAFYGMPALRHLRIPAGVTSVGTQAFGSCASLVNIFFAGDPTVSAGVLSGSPQARPVIPQGSGLTSAFASYASYSQSGDWCYGSWLGMTGQVILGYLGGEAAPEFPEALGGLPVAGIAPHAFFNSQNLAALSLPEGCGQIGAGAFALCGALQALTVHEDLASFTGADIFYGNPEVTLLGYRNSSAQAYAETNNLAFTLLQRVTFEYTGGSSPFQEAAVNANGESLIFGFTEDYKTPAQLRGAFSLPVGRAIYFLRPDGAELGEDELVGTGTQILLYDSQKGHLDTLVCVIYGDLNSDGLVDGRDALIFQYIYKGILQPETLDLSLLLAADADRDGELSWNDFVWMSESGMGSRKVSQDVAW